MSRLGSLFRSRITLAVVGVLLVGGGGAVWAVTSNAPATHQAANSLTNPDSTSTASVEDPTATATTDPGATATATTVRPTSTPRATATPCLTPTPIPVGQSVQWRGSVASVGATSFVLRVGCGRPTITVDTATQWLGQATQITDLHAGWIATVMVTRRPNATYLATSVTAQPPVNN